MVAGPVVVASSLLATGAKQRKLTRLMMMSRSVSSPGRAMDGYRLVATLQSWPVASCSASTLMPAGSDAGVVSNSGSVVGVAVVVGFVVGAAFVVGSALVVVDGESAATNSRSFSLRALARSSSLASARSLAWD